MRPRPAPPRGVTRLVTLGGALATWPPWFDAALDYPGTSRLVAWTWRPFDGAVYVDAREAGVGRPLPFIAWSVALDIAPVLPAGLHGDAPPRWGLVHDRWSGALWLGSWRHATAWVRRGVGDPRRRPRVPVPAPPARLAEAWLTAAAVDRTLEWLAARTVPCPSCDAESPNGRWRRDATAEPSCPQCLALFWGPDLVRAVDRHAQRFPRPSRHLRPGVL